MSQKEGSKWVKIFEGWLASVVGARCGDHRCKNDQRIRAK
jgi:hypothetical protein